MLDLIIENIASNSKAKIDFKMTQVLLVKVINLYKQKMIYLLELNM